MKTVVYSAKADRDLTALDPAVASRIEAKVDRYAATGEGDAKALTGRPGVRLRIGMWRAVLIEDAERVTVIAVAKRDQVYK